MATPKKSDTGSDRKLVVDWPWEANQAFYKVERIAESINKFVGFDLKFGSIWSSFDNPYADFLDQIGDIDVNFAMKQSGPFVFLEVTSRDGEQTLLKASRHLEDYGFADAPGRFYEWHMNTCVPGEWTKRLDEYEVMLRFFRFLKDHVKEKGDHRLILDPVVIENTKSAMLRYRSSGFWIDPESILKV